MEKFKTTCQKCNHSNFIDAKAIELKKNIIVSISNINQIYHLFKCSKCLSYEPYLYDENSELIFDPNDLKFCSNCDFPITMQRRNITNDKTNICSAKCVDEIETKEKLVHLDAAPGMPQGEKSICPRCGKKLEVRNGPTGWFLGCTNYPKCRGTRKI